MESEFDILTKKKLELEIEGLKKAWYKKPKYIAALSPIIIALLSFLAVWLSGYFDTQKEKLNKEISELEVIRDSLTDEVSSTLDSLKYAKILHFEMILNRDKVYLSDYEEIFDYLCLNIADKIIFYNAIMKSPDLLAFLNEFEIELIISNDFSSENMDWNKRSELFNKYAKYNFVSDLDDGFLYAYNKSEFVTDERGKQIWDERISDIKALFNNRFKSKIDSLDYHNNY